LFELLKNSCVDVKLIRQ